MEDEEGRHKRRRIFWISLRVESWILKFWTALDRNEQQQDHQLKLLSKLTHTDILVQQLLTLLRGVSRLCIHVQSSKSYIIGHPTGLGSHWLMTYISAAQIFPCPRIQDILWTHRACDLESLSRMPHGLNPLFPPTRRIFGSVPWQSLLATSPTRPWDRIFSLSINAHCPSSVMHCCPASLAISLIP